MFVWGGCKNAPHGHRLLVPSVAGKRASGPQTTSFRVHEGALSAASRFGSRSPALGMPSWHLSALKFTGQKECQTMGVRGMHPDVGSWCHHGKAGRFEFPQASSARLQTATNVQQDPSKHGSSQNHLASSGYAPCRSIGLDGMQGGCSSTQPQTGELRVMAKLTFCTTGVTRSRAPM
jgi:hypothetical protein